MLVPFHAIIALFIVFVHVVVLACSLVTSFAIVGDYSMFCQFLAIIGRRQSWLLSCLLWSFICLGQIHTLRNTISKSMDSTIMTGIFIFLFDSTCDILYLSMFT